MLGTLSIAATLLLTPTLGAQPNVQALYESRCLYCHSDARVKELRLPPSEWRRMVQRMQAKAPLLISRSDIEPLVRYLVNDRKLVPKEPARSSVPAVAATTRPAPGGRDASPAPPVPEAVAPPVEPEPPTPASAALADLPSPEDREAEALGPVLLEEKCSKCHTLNRVFTKIDSLEAGEAIIDRMRKKTGSGISPDDARILRRFLGSRTGR